MLAATGVDSREHVNAKALAGHSRHGGVAARCLGRPAVEVRTHPSLVLEEALRILPLREYVNLRVIPLQPLLEVLVH